MKTKKEYLKIGLYSLAVLFILFAPFISASRYQQHLFVLAGIYVLLTAGINLLTGYVGLLSLCHAVFFGFGAYTAALLDTRFGIPFILTLILAGIASGVVSYLFSFIGLRVRGSAFIIMSVSFLHLMHLLTLNLTDITQGQMGIGNITRANL